MSRISRIVARFAALAFLCLGIQVPSLHAQAVAVAQIAGRVADPTGAAVAQVEVRALQTETQFTRVTQTDSDGRYVLPNLPVGPYALEVSASGFKKLTRTGILLRVGENIELNLNLELGSVLEKMEVKAEASMVEAKENSIGTVIDQRRVIDLPLNGRQATQLILLSGGAVMPPANNLVGSKYSYAAVVMSIAGGQANGTYYLLDGGDNNETNSNVNMPLPFPEAIQEFSVQTSSLPARYGFRSGGAVNVVTKSGTNEWHGDAFEFLRNGAVNARNFFSASSDGLKRHQFGGVLGGPVRRNRLFIFGGDQATRNRQQPSHTIAYVPTAQSLGGDFSVTDSGGCVSGGRGRTLLDPATRQPFPGNQIPASRFEPASVTLARKYLPAAQDTCGKITYGIPRTGDDDEIIGRVDWVATDKHLVFGRYFIDDYRNPGYFDGRNILASSVPGNLQRSQSLTAGDTYTFGPSLLNSFRATFTRMRNNRGPGPNLPVPSDWGTKVYALQPGFPGSIGVTGAFSVGCGTCSPAHINNNNYQLTDDIDLIRGRHQLAFGANVIRTQANTLTGTLSNGSYTFDGSFTTDPMADYLLGSLSSFSQASDQQRDLRQTILGFYVQDTFKLAPRVTLNIGLRWEPYLPVTDKFHRGSIFDPAGFAAGKKSSVFVNAPAGSLFYGDPGVSKSFSDGKLANLAPRVGLVFSPSGNGRDSLRLGAGILLDSTMVFFTQRIQGNPPYANAITLQAPPGGFGNPFLNYPGGSPFPAPAKPPKDFAFPLSGSFAVPPGRLDPTYTAQWNISYQRQFGANWKTSITYLGNKTTHMQESDTLNPAVFIPGTCGSGACSTTANTNQRRVLSLQNPNEGKYYGDVQLLSSGFNSRYNGLLLSVERRFASGFTLLSNYTWSHCLGDREFFGDVTGPSYEIPFNRAADFGNCNFDVRQNFNTSMVIVSPMKANGMAGRLLARWQLAPILRYTSGLPMNVTTGTDNSRTGIGQDRPNQVLPDAYRTNDPMIWVNRAAFAPAAIGAFGNISRNLLRGPGAFTLDGAVSRQFRLRESWNLEFRAEAFNAINHTNFANPGTNLSSAAFGRLQGAGEPRILQFAMKVHF